MKKAIFEIGSHEGYYVGYTSGHRWNGWEMPYFDKETVNRILRELPLEHSDFAPKFDWYGDVLMETDEGESYEVGTTIIDGVTYYRLGDGWVWEEHELMNPHAKVLVKDMSGRGFDWTLTAFEHSIDNVEDTELVEFLRNCEVGDTHTSYSIKSIIIE